jgi:hypothetical protein
MGALGIFQILRFAQNDTLKIDPTALLLFCSAHAFQNAALLRSPVPYCIRAKFSQPRG